MIETEQNIVWESKPRAIMPVIVSPTCISMTITKARVIVLWITMVKEATPTARKEIETNDATTTKFKTSIQK